MDQQSAIEELRRRGKIAYKIGAPEKIIRLREHGHITAREGTEAVDDPITEPAINLTEF